jgi:hypothetical protein
MATGVAGAGRGLGLRVSAYVVWAISKDLVVMSQLDHHPWNLESTEAAPVWSVALPSCQPSKKNLEEGAPVLCRSLLS